MNKCCNKIIKKVWVVSKYPAGEVVTSHFCYPSLIPGVSMRDVVTKLDGLVSSGYSGFLQHIHDYTITNIDANKNNLYKLLFLVLLLLLFF